MNQETDRQLAAIMFTDIVGYTALMQEDEQRAVRLRNKHRKVFKELHEKYDGRIVQYYGDGTLSVFSSAVHASSCAIEIQRLLQDGDPVPLRIGLHLGDIVFDNTEVYGDAVNLAARIESLAVAGSVLLSSALNDQLKNKESITTISLGSFDFKNVAEPVEIFALKSEELVIPDREMLSGKTTRSQKSIAVLPFVNMSADANNEYLSDGITEDIINALSKIESLRVTSRTSSFYFKDKALPIKKVAQELGVSAILEGSVRLAGNALRISAQLIQAEDDYHFWSETWDRKLENIFEIQDEISLLIADKLREQFGHFEIQDHLVDKQTKSLKVYELYLRARYLINKWNPEDVNTAAELLSEGTELDDQHAESFVALADCYSFLGTTGFVPYAEAWQKANEYLLIAQQLDRNLPEVNYHLGNEAYFIKGDYPQAVLEMQKAVASRPNFAKAHQFVSFLYIIAGDEHNCRKHIDLALTIDPKSQQALFFDAYYYYMVGDLEKAIRLLDDCIRVNDKSIPAHSVKATAFLCLGRYDEAINYYDTIPPEVVIPEEENGVKWLGHYLKGEEDQSKIYFEKIKELLDGHNSITAGAYIFFHHVLSGEIDQAFEWLEESLKNKSYVPSMRIADPLVSALRSDPRWEQMQKRIFQAEKGKPEDKRKKALLDEQKTAEALQNLQNHLVENRPYLDPELSLRSLADQIGIQANQLSWLINDQLDKNFNDLINHYRIVHFKSLAVDPANAGFTIMGLAYDSGFNSKTTFNNSFKKETGQTPRQFMRS